MVYLYLALSGILDGGVIFGAKVLSNLGASLFELMIYPNLLSVLFIAYFARCDLHKLWRIPLKMKFLFAAALFFITLGQYTPIFLKIPVTLVVLLIYLQPVWTILIERFYFRRRQTLLNWFLVGCMIVGLWFLINPSGGTELSPWGVLLAVLGGVGLSLWLIVAQYFSRQNVSPSGTFLAASVYTQIPVFALYWILRILPEFNGVRIFSLEMPPQLWLYFVIYTLASYVAPNLLLFANNRNVSPVIVGMLLLLEPVTGLFLDWMFLGKPLTWNILLGGAIILISNAVLIRTQE